jgi:ABC-type polysaccharide transport system permease subunit
MMKWSKTLRTNLSKKHVMNDTMLHHFTPPEDSVSVKNMFLCYFEIAMQLAVSKARNLAAKCYVIHSTIILIPYFITSTMAVSHVLTLVKPDGQCIRPSRILGLASASHQVCL